MPIVGSWNKVILSKSYELFSFVSLYSNLNLSIKKIKLSKLVSFKLTNNNSIIF